MKKEAVVGVIAASVASAMTAVLVAGQINAVQTPATVTVHSVADEAPEAPEAIPSPSVGPTPQPGTTTPASPATSPPPPTPTKAPEVRAEEAAVSAAVAAQQADDAANRAEQAAQQVQQPAPVPSPSPLSPTWHRVAITGGGGGHPALTSRGEEGAAVMGPMFITTARSGHYRISWEITEYHPGRLEGRFGDDAQTTTLAFWVDSEAALAGVKEVHLDRAGQTFPATISSMRGSPESGEPTPRYMVTVEELY